MTHLEWRIQMMRGACVAFGMLQLLLARDSIPRASLIVSLVLLAILGVTAATALGMLRCWPGDELACRIAKVSLPLDVAIVTGVIAAWEFEVGGGTWALSLLLPIAGAARWARRGAWWAWCGAVLGLVTAYAVGDALFARGHQLADYTFAVGLLAVATVIIGETANRVVTLVANERATHTERLQALLDREQILVERERLASLRGEYTAAMSHELRTPVTGLRGFSETMLERWDSFDEAQLRSFMKVLHEQAMRLEHLVLDMLQLVEIEHPRNELDYEEVSAQEIVDRLQLTDGHSVPIAAGHDLHFIADRLRVETLVQRLVDNALAHGKPPIEATFEAISGGTRITIRDRGPGVPDAIADRLFDRFVHAEGTTGRGLGLAVAQAIVHAHQGAMWHERRDGATQFVAELPHPQCRRTVTIDTAKNSRAHAPHEAQSRLSERRTAT